MIALSFSYPELNEWCNQFIRGFNERQRVENILMKRKGFCNFLPSKS
jgi:hypothetical protein